MMIESMSWRWRCSGKVQDEKCKKLNPAKLIECVKCGKMRWAQFGLSREEVVGLLSAILPDNMQRAIRKTA